MSTGAQTAAGADAGAPLQLQLAMAAGSAAGGGAAAGSSSSPARALAGVGGADSTGSAAHPGDRMAAACAAPPRALEFRRGATPEKLNALAARLPAGHSAEHAGRQKLLRFLVARGGDVDAACAMYREHLVWAAANLPVDRATVLPALRTSLCYVRGHDIGGRAVVTWRAAEYDQTVMTEQLAEKLMVYNLGLALRSGRPGSDGKITLIVFSCAGSYWSKSLFKVCALAGLCARLSRMRPAPYPAAAAGPSCPRLRGDGLDSA